MRVFARDGVKGRIDIESAAEKPEKARLNAYAAKEAGKAWDRGAKLLGETLDELGGLACLRAVLLDVQLVSRDL